MSSRTAAFCPRNAERRRVPPMLDDCAEYYQAHAGLRRRSLANAETPGSKHMRQSLATKRERRCPQDRTKTASGAPAASRTACRSSSHPVFALPRSSPPCDSSRFNARSQVLLCNRSRQIAGRVCRQKHPALSRADITDACLQLCGSSAIVACELDSRKALSRAVKWIPEIQNCPSPRAAALSCMWQDVPPIGKGGTRMRGFALCRLWGARVWPAKRSLDE